MVVLYVVHAASRKTKRLYVPFPRDFLCKQLSKAYHDFSESTILRRKSHDLLPQINQLLTIETSWIPYFVHL